MTARTPLLMSAGILVTAALSLSASVLRLGSELHVWPTAWQYMGEGLMIATLIAALVWSTGLARRHSMDAIPTGALALFIGGSVLFGTSLVTEFTFWPILHALTLPPIDAGMMTRHDSRWIISKVFECVVYVLPFAIWRALQQRRRSALIVASPLAQ